jgi:hypothetical protein
VPEAQTLLEAGRPRAAAALFDSVARWWLPGLDEHWRARQRAWERTHAANALAAAGDTATLAALAESVRVDGARSGFVRDGRLHHHVRGLLLAARGRDAEASAAFAAAQFSAAFGYSRTSLELARALVRLGRPSDAVRVLGPTLRSSFESLGFYATHTELEEALAAAWERAGRPDSAAAHHRAVARAWADGDPPFRARAAAAAAAATRLAGGAVTPPARPPAR